MTLFNKDFLKALSAWQTGWNEDQDKRRKLADDLINASESLPLEFRECNQACYRKRFPVTGELFQILMKDEGHFEGIASWSLTEDTAEKFKGIVNRAGKEAMIFRHFPKANEVVLNIDKLWQNEDFKRVVAELNHESPEIAYPLFNFKGQKEVILRSTLKGEEIVRIVGRSSDFDTIADKAGYSQEEREKLSVQYAKDVNAIPIGDLTLASKNATGKALKKAIGQMRENLKNAAKDGKSYYNQGCEPHPDDLKHMPKN